MAQEIPAFIPTKLRPRVDMEPQQLRKAILNHGSLVKWERAAECPCTRQLTVTSSTGGITSTFSNYTKEIKADCEACNGTGLIYHSPQNVTALILDFNRDPERFSVHGQFSKGGARFTMLPEHTPGYFDRLTNLSAYVEFREVLERKEGAVQSLRYPIVTRKLVAGTDGAQSTAQLISMDVVYVRVANADGSVTGTELVSGTDFEVTSDGKLDFTIADGAGKGPAVGSRFSVSYYINPAYRVHSFPFIYRHDEVAPKTSKKAGLSFDEFKVDHIRELPVKLDCYLEWLGGPE